MCRISYCLYLRKSRADMEAEAHGEGETLARHEKLLLELAKKRNYNVTQIYREVVSGETIAARPVMQHLLQEVEQGLWDGVIVVEVERLARGDTIDQGIMAQAFKYSNTLIITPLKVYDPNNEFDEEYFEFGLFMSRREYKTINRRLQRGRVASSKEGKYAASRSPYGYERVRIQNDKGWTLKPVEDEADIVRLIFKLYADGQELADGSYRSVGCRVIGNILDQMGVSPPSSASYWTEASIRHILRNPVYIGKVRWNTKKRKKRVKDGNVSYERVTPPPEEQVFVDGLHPPIIDEDTFYKVQDVLKSHSTTSTHRHAELQNPFAGLLRCGKCGRVLTRRNVRGSISYLCPNKLCDCVMSRADIIEERILQALHQWLDSYRLEWDEDAPSEYDIKIDIKRREISKSKKEIETLSKQLARTHDLLEQGVYDVDMFLSRSRSINDRMEAANDNITELSRTLAEDEERAASRISIIPKVEHLLSVYDELPDAQSKNDLLKEIVERIEYTKDEPSSRNGPYDNFELVLYPKIPTSAGK